MNKISSTGLNLVSKNVKENMEQTKSIQKEIINTQQDIIKDTKREHTSEFFQKRVAPMPVCIQ